MEKNALTVSWGALWKILFMIAMGALIYFSRKILLAFVLSIVISSALDPIVSWLSRKKIPRLVGTLIVFMVSGAIIGVILYAIIPLALLELNNLLENFDQITTRLFGPATSGVDFFGFNPENLNDINKLFRHEGDSFLGTASSLIGGIAIILSVFILS